MKYKIIVILVFALLFGCSKSNDSITKVVTTTAEVADSSLQLAPKSFADLYKNVESEVVTIHAESLQNISNPIHSGTNDKSLELRKSTGSGFIINSDGYVITSAHVVKNLSNILVTLNTQQDLPAKLIGIDDVTDIALLKITAESLPFVTVASALSQVGDWVFAIGSPYGFSNSLTAGVISNTTRVLTNKVDTDGNSIWFLQTDAPINPGSSGSPLFNLQGEVIGMNSLIYSPDPGYSGISFALPIKLVMQAVNIIIARARLNEALSDYGIELSAIKATLLKKIGVKMAWLVTDIKPNATYSGLILGDVVLGINNTNDLDQVLQSLANSKTVTFSVLRDTQHLYITLKHP